jgi:hypothetical protein
LSLSQHFKKMLFLTIYYLYYSLIIKSNLYSLKYFRFPKMYSFLWCIKYNFSYHRNEKYLNRTVLQYRFFQSPKYVVSKFILSDFGPLKKPEKAFKCVFSDDVLKYYDFEPLISKNRSFSIKIKAKNNFAIYFFQNELLIVTFG